MLHPQQIPNQEKPGHRGAQSAAEPVGLIEKCAKSWGGAGEIYQAIPEEVMDHG